jgi:hypothetical protein
VITPIETGYKGYRFRSRLEARWAVFFDALDIKWQYEPQGYTVGPNKRPYLPDFLLPELRAFVEVKGDPERLDLEPLADLVRRNRDASFLLILGQIPLLEPGAVPTHAMLMPAFDWQMKLPPIPMVHRALAAVQTLPDEERVVVEEFMSYERRTAVAYQRFFFVSGSEGCSHFPIGFPNLIRSGADVLDPQPMWQIMPMPRIQRAYEAARSARFEHGESGAA